MNPEEGWRQNLLGAETAGTAEGRGTAGGVNHSDANWDQSQVRQFQQARDSSAQGARTLGSRANRDAAGHMTQKRWRRPSPRTPLTEGQIAAAIHAARGASVFVVRDGDTWKQISKQEAQAFKDA